MNTVCLFLALNGNGQTGFNNYYQSGWRSVAGKCIEINANEFLVVGYFEDSISGQQGLDLRRIDALGQTLQHKRHLFKDLNFLRFISNDFQINISNSTMLVTGGSNTTVIYASVNKNSLDTNWVRYYSDGVLGFRLSDILKIQANEFWFFGDAGNSSSYVRPYALKIDSMGNVISTLNLTTLPNHQSRQSCFDSGTQKIFFTGENYTNPQIQQNHVTCIDLSGNIIWYKQLGVHPFLSAFNDMEVRNNYLLLSGLKWTKYEGSYNYFKLSLLKLDASNGDSIWQRTYGEDLINNMLNAFSINSDESITAVGVYQFPSYNPIGLNTNGVILKADANGDSLWMHSYSNHGVGKVETFHDILPTSDGGYIMCGAPHYANPCHSWVVKTDSLGMGPGLYTHPVGMADLIDDANTIKIYPNPVIDEYYIETSELNCEFQLFNVYGNQVMTGELKQMGKNRIDTGELAFGVYFLKIYNNERLIKSVKLIIASE